MWCLWALPLLGLAVRVASEGTVPVSCNGTWLDVQPPLYVKMFTDEAHFVCSSGFKLQGQNILTCINTNWDHPVPVCEKLPPRTITSKTPDVLETGPLKRTIHPVSRRKLPFSDQFEAFFKYTKDDRAQFRKVSTERPREPDQPEPDDEGDGDWLTSDEATVANDEDVSYKYR